MIRRFICLLRGHDWSDEVVGIPTCHRCRLMLRPWR